MAEPARAISGAAPGALTDAILASNELLVLRGLVASWPLVKASLRSQREGIAYLRRFHRGEMVRALVELNKARVMRAAIIQKLKR